jgi:hypothetical protein
VRNERSPSSNKYPKCLLDEASILAALQAVQLPTRLFDVSSSGKEIFALLSRGSSKYFAFLDSCGSRRFHFDSSEVKIARRRKSVKKILISAFLAFHNH